LSELKTAYPNNISVLRIDSTRIPEIDLANYPQLYHFDHYKTACKTSNFASCPDLHWYVDYMYFRNNLEVSNNIKKDNWGTLCFPHDVTNYDNCMEVYEVKAYFQNYMAEPKALVVTQVAKGTKMKAGKPYVVKFLNDTIKTDVGGECISQPHETKGAQPSFSRTSVREGFLFLRNNKVVRAADETNVQLPYRVTYDPSQLPTWGYNTEDESGQITNCKTLEIINDNTTNIVETINPDLVTTPFDISGKKTIENKRMKIYIIDRKKVMK